MKNYKVILIIFLILISTTILIAFQYIAALKRQNNALSANINQIAKRITVLELDKTMEQISILKAKNIALKKEIEDLKAELSRLSQKAPRLSRKGLRQEIKKLPEKEKTVLGNKGFLIKESRSNQ